jgi:hypothetical protein
MVHRGSLGLLVGLFLLGGCCSAPGPDVTHKFAQEIAAVKEILNVGTLDVSVYETSRPQDFCDGAHGCCDSCGVIVPDAPVLMLSRLCPPESDNPGCWDDPHEVAAHELVHAALGPSSSSHPPEFWRALEKVRAVLE